MSFVKILENSLNPSFWKKPRISFSEVITITLLFHLSGFRKFKHSYIYYVKTHMQKEFTKTFSYNRFVELIQSNLMTMFTKTYCLGVCTRISFIDSIPIRVCKNKRIKRNKIFKDIARFLFQSTAKCYKLFSKNTNYFRPQTLKPS